MRRSYLIVVLIVALAAPVAGWTRSARGHAPGDPWERTNRRTFAFNDIIIKKEEFPELRSFFQKFEAKDHDSIVLKVNTPSASTPAGGN